MRATYFRLLLAIFAGSALLRAQSTLPTVQPIPAQTIASAETALNIDLRTYFGLAGVTGTVVQFTTILGRFNVEMLNGAAPVNSANFLNYVNAGSYTNSFFHRAAAIGGGPVAILQGGGYTWSAAGPTPIFHFNPVPLEYNLPNARGTLAAAQFPGDVNSATSEWYFNVQDNSTTLGPLNGGGYTVFGRVLGSGMTVVDAMAAFPRYNAGGAFAELPMRNYTSGNISSANLAIINSVVQVSVYPEGSGPSVLTFSGENSAGSVVNAAIAGSTLTLSPLTTGAAIISLHATDTNGNAVNGSVTVSVLESLSKAVAAGASATIDAPTGVAAFQWQRNGVAVTGGTSTALTVNNVQPENTGIYYAFATTNGTTVNTRPAILGLKITPKLLGTGQEVGTDIVHPNKNVFDQILLQGSALSFRADAQQVTRTSFIDSNDDIVQVEYSGPGTVSIVMDTPGTAGTPLKYNQPSVSYIKGHAGIVVAGATEASNISVFTVGRATAFDPTGVYNILQAPSATNVPANNGSPLFVGQNATIYDGVADIAFIAISSADGKFGGIRTANTSYFATKGITGIYAPGVQFTGPIFVGNIDAHDNATPMLVVGGVANSRITGGDLLQSNGRPVQVAGLTQLIFQAGSDSHGRLFAAKNNQAVLQQDGVNVTTQIVVNP